MKNIGILLIAIFLLGSCATGKRISKFSTHQVELGIDIQDFIDKYGQPSNQEAQYGKRNLIIEKLFYKEELYHGTWFIVTTSFTFHNSRLVKQEIKEERQFQSCTCKDDK